MSTVARAPLSARFGPSPERSTAGGGPDVSGVAVERVDLSRRLGRLRFIRAGEELYRSTGGSRPPGMFAESVHLDPERSPGLACMEALGLVARVDGRIRGRMVVLRPAGGGDTGWFSRLDLRAAPPVLAALVAEGARWIRRAGGRRWLGPVGLMPGEVCGVQIDGFVGRRVGDLPQCAPGMDRALTSVGFSLAAESGFWSLPVAPHPIGLPAAARAPSQVLDPTSPASVQAIDWPQLLARLPRTTDPVARLHCDPVRLRQELLRAAVPGGVAYVAEAGGVAAVGVLRPHCAAAPGIDVPRWVARMRYWKRRQGSGEGIAQIFTIAERAADPLLAGAVLDRLVRTARDLGYRRVLVGPVSTEAQGAITTLRDRGARIDRRYHVYAQEIDPADSGATRPSSTSRRPLTRQH